MYQQQLNDNDLANWEGYECLLERVFQTKPKLTPQQKEYYAKEKKRQHRLQHLEEARAYQKKYYQEHKQYYVDYRKKYINKKHDND